MKTTPLLENICKTTFSALVQTVKQLENNLLRSNYNKNKYLIFEPNGKTVYIADCVEPSLISIDLNVFKTKPIIIEEVEQIVFDEFINRHF